MKYRYEMHRHTSPCSHCGKADPEKLPIVMKEEGYTGCVITDHFYYGNSGIERTLPWNEFCRPYEETYLKAKAVGDKIDFDILFGIEEHVGEGKEILIYGITPEFMYKYPEMREGGLERIYKFAKNENALVIQAHPFRSRDYIPEPMKKLSPDFLDGYELFNASNKPEDNKNAFEIYSGSGKIFTAGTDCHRDNTIVPAAGIETDVRIKSEKQLADILRSGNYQLFGVDFTEV